MQKNCILLFLCVQTIRLITAKSTVKRLMNFLKKQDDMISCGYNPIAGGGREADACVRKKGWYVWRNDIFPENKIYEQCQHE